MNRAYIAVPKFSLVKFAAYSVTDTEECTVFELDFDGVPKTGEEISAMSGKAMLTVTHVVWEIPKGKSSYHPVIFCDVLWYDR